MPDFREFFSDGQGLDHFVDILHRSDGPMRMFSFLRPNEQKDIIEGRCIYREYQGTPILDYTCQS